MHGSEFLHQIDARAIGATVKGRRKQSDQVPREGAGLRDGNLKMIRRRGRYRTGLQRETILLPIGSDAGDDCPAKRFPALIGTRPTVTGSVAVSSFA